MLLALALVCVHLRPDDQPIRIASTDYWEHARLIGELISRSTVERGSTFSNDNVQQKTPYIIGLAWMGHILGWNSQQVLLTMATLNILLLAVALVRFGRRWTHRRLPWGLLIAVPFLFWGKGFFQSNEYHLATLPMTAAYPSTFSFALSLLSLSLLADVCRLGQGRTGRAIVLLTVATLLATCVELTHLLTFLCFFIPTAGLTGLFLSRSKRAWAEISIFPAIALCLLLWPWPEATYKQLSNYVKDEKQGNVERQRPPAQPNRLSNRKARSRKPKRKNRPRSTRTVYGTL